MWYCWLTAASVAGYNLLKQWALQHGSGISPFEARYRPVYWAIALGGAAVWAVDLLDAAIVVRVVVTGLAVVPVLLVGRSLLMVDELFPELRRVPLLGRLPDRKGAVA